MSVKPRRELCGAVYKLTPDQPPCAKEKDHATEAPDTDWKRGYHSNGMLKWRADGADIPDVGTVSALVKWRTTAQIARRGEQLVADAACTWLGEGPNAGFIIDLLRGLVLDACGCTCSPARRMTPDAPAVFPGDLTCPAHAVPIGLGALNVERLWRVRDMRSNGAIVHASLEAAEADLAGHRDAWWTGEMPGHALETALQLTFEGGMVFTSDWDLLKIQEPSQPPDA